MYYVNCADFNKMSDHAQMPVYFCMTDRIKNQLPNFF